MCGPAHPLTRPAHPRALLIPKAPLEAASKAGKRAQQRANHDKVPVMHVNVDGVLGPEVCREAVFVVLVACAQLPPQGSTRHPLQQKCLQDLLGSRGGMVPQRVRPASQQVQTRRDRGRKLWQRGQRLLHCQIGSTLQLVVQTLQTSAFRKMRAKQDIGREAAIHERRTPRLELVRDPIVGVAVCDVELERILATTPKSCPNLNVIDLKKTLQPFGPIVKSRPPPPPERSLPSLQLKQAINKKKTLPSHPRGSSTRAIVQNVSKIKQGNLRRSFMPPKLRTPFETQCC